MATERNVVDFKIHNLTEEQFQELKAQGKIDPNAMYCTPDETVVNFGAVNTRIDETNNTLNTRIEEINDRIDETNNALNDRIDETNNALNDRIDVVGSEIESLKDKGGMPVLTPMWFDHISNDMSWLRADTFSWQSGDVYVAAYEHLVADCENAQTTTYYAWTGEGYILGTQDTVYTTSQTPAVGDAVYLYSDGDISALAVGTITSSSSASIAYKSAVDGTTRSAFAYSGEVQLPVHMETIAGVTITYCLSQDGHKICTSDDESKVVAIYEATGVAWYYLLDTENKQFKLPRTKWGFTGLRDSVGGYVDQDVLLPNITGTITGDLTPRGDGGHGTSGAFTHTDATVYGRGASADTTYFHSISLSASRSSSVYSGDGTNTLIQPRGTQMYLYFYVGNFEQSAVEQTAGLNAEMFNDLNAHKIIEVQNPTAENGYTWYRKYADGWVEQGGYNSTVSGAVNITLPIEMLSSVYDIQAHPLIGNNVSDTTTVNRNAAKAYIRMPYNQTTTGFTLPTSADMGQIGTYWQVCGIAA